MFIEATLISLPVESATELVKDMFEQVAIWGGLSLLFGYLCVAIALGIFKFLQVKGFIAKEIPPALAEL